jgi:hypothetical protein
MKWDFKKWLVKEMTCWKWLGNQMTGDEIVGSWSDWLMKWLEID